MEYRSKSDVVADALREEIRLGRLESGALLRQRDLADRFGVSPTPVREALRRLEAEGFVVSVLHRGAQVVRREQARLEENFLIRAALEPLAAQLAAERITADDLTELTRLHERLSAADDCDAAALAELNQAFHLRIYEAAASPVLMTLLRLLWSSAGETPSRRRGARESSAQHAAILDALRRGDGEAAADKTRLHIEEAMR
jgi:DNA-binding GntR family transcriptional regulator